MIFTEDFKDKLDYFQLFFLCAHNEVKETGRTKIYTHVENKANIFIQKKDIFDEWTSRQDRACLVLLPKITSGSSRQITPSAALHFSFLCQLKCKV